MSKSFHKPNPWRSVYVDDNHRSLTVRGHTEITTYVYKMRGESEPDKSLKDFHRILLNAPVFESFTKQMVDLLDDSEGRELIDVFEDAMKLIEVTEVDKYLPDHKIHAEIEELEKQIAKLRAKL